MTVAFVDAGIVMAQLGAAVVAADLVSNLPLLRRNCEANTSPPPPPDWNAFAFAHRFPAHVRPAELHGSTHAELAVMQVKRMTELWRCWSTSGAPAPLA